MSTILFSLCIGLGMAVGDILMKKWMLAGYAVSGSALAWLCSALAVYGISLVGYGFLLKTLNLNVATLVTVSFNVLVVALIGTFIFGESINGHQIAGMILCLLGIGLIMMR
jgi:drug/metabolite transporter (DMT)-like permease